MNMALSSGAWSPARTALHMASSQEQGRGRRVWSSWWAPATSKGWARRASSCKTNGSDARFILKNSMQMNHKEMQLVKNSRGLDPHEKAWAAGECSPMNEMRPALPRSEKSTRKVSVGQKQSGQKSLFQGCPGIRPAGAPVLSPCTAWAESKENA